MKNFVMNLKYSLTNFPIEIFRVSANDSLKTVPSQKKDVWSRHEEASTRIDKLSR